MDRSGAVADAYMQKLFFKCSVCHRGIQSKSERYKNHIPIISLSLSLSIYICVYNVFGQIDCELLAPETMNGPRSPQHYLC